MHANYLKKQLKKMTFDNLAEEIQSQIPSGQKAMIFTFMHLHFQFLVSLKKHLPFGFVLQTDDTPRES